MIRKIRIEDLIRSFENGIFRIPLDLEVNALRRRALDVGMLFLICALVGVIAGLGAAGFHYLLQFAKHLFMDGLAGYRPPGPLGEVPIFPFTARPFSRWILFILPAAGGLVSGIIVYYLAPEAEGHGTDAAIDEYHNRYGLMRARVPFVKAIASAITIGTGGSAGREGPIAQIGAGLGSNIAQWLGLPSSQRRVIMAAGLGAGIGAIFRAPLAGALFAAEVLYRDMDLEYEVIAPGILSSIIAYSTFGMFFGWEPLFFTPNFHFVNPLELGPYLALALAVALGGRVYAQVFYFIRDVFRRIRIPNWTKPAIGGLFVGAIGLSLPQALSTGFGVVQDAIYGKTPAGLLFVIAIAKIFATAFTVATGGSGGVFGPAVVIGGSIGGAVGLSFHQWLPNLVPEPSAFAMVGMAGFFAAAAHVPISTVIMVSEMTGNYQLLVPAMFVCMFGFLLVRNHSIYENQLPTRADSPAHRRIMLRSVMERLRVSDLLTTRKHSPPEALSESSTLSEVLDRFASNEYSALPVVNKNGALIGSVAFDTALQMVEGSDKGPCKSAKDLTEPAVTIGINQSIYEAIHAMVSNRRQELLVLDDTPDHRVIDVLTSADIDAVNQEYEESDNDIENVYQKIRNAIKRRGAKSPAK